MPTVSYLTADFPAMGTMSLPSRGQIESMELSVTKGGVDLGLGRMAMMQAANMELRWVQDVMQADGLTRPEGCKAFLRVISKSIPGLAVASGSLSSNDLTYEVFRYQLFAGGEELWLIDRLAQIMRVLGVDYYKSIDSML